MQPLRREKRGERNQSLLQGRWEKNPEKGVKEGERTRHARSSGNKHRGDRKEWGSATEGGRGKQSRVPQSLCGSSLLEAKNETTSETRERNLYRVLLGTPRGNRTNKERGTDCQREYKEPLITSREGCLRLGNGLLGKDSTRTFGRRRVSTQSEKIIYLCEGRSLREKDVIPFFFWSPSSRKACPRGHIEDVEENPVPEDPT